MKSASIKVSKKISAPANAVWQTISAIGGVDKWLAMIKTCRFEGTGAGAKRVCTTADGATLYERIEAVDHEKRIFQYSIAEPPMPIKNLLGTMQVIAGDNGNESQVDWSATFEVEEAHAAEMIAMLEGIYSEGITGLEKLHAA
ncbi:SRPBCC family protein [candidate division KSB1 bacterium]|nr:SRPBCC family protein [candidate division KSB1 bacterium]